MEKENVKKKPFHKNKYQLVCPQIALTYRCNLSCKNCFAKGIEDCFPKDISLDNFKKCIKWLKKEKISSVHFMGKEPTTHPKFIEIINICKEEQIFFSLSTNMTFSKKIATELCDNSFFTGSLTHYFFSSNKSSNIYKKYRQNLNFFSKKGINIKLFLMLPVSKNNLRDVTKLLEKYNKNMDLAGAPTLPFFSKNPKKFNEIKRDARLSVKNLLFLKKRGLVLKIPDCSPTIRCAFNDKEVLRLKKVTDKEGFPLIIFKQFIGKKYPNYTSSYAARMHINTDLSIFPSPTFFFKTKNLLSFKNIKEIDLLFKKFYNRWRWEIPVAKECLTCEYFLKKICQGGSLYYKLHKNYHKKGSIFNIYDII